MRVDGFKVEQCGTKVEGELVKGENSENILAEERDGMKIYPTCIIIRIIILSIYVLLK